VAMGSEVCGASWFATLTNNNVCVVWRARRWSHKSKSHLFCFNVRETLWPKPCLVSL